MIARVRNIITGEVVDVRSTTEHPDSSYGNPVWVDADNVAYGQVDLPMPLYEVMDVEVYDREEIGIAIRNIREILRISSGDLAERAGLNKNTITNIERGKFSARVDVLISILTALGAKLTIKIED